MSHNKVAGAPGLDPTLPNVTLILAGVERHPCFDFNAIVIAEKATGINLLKSIVSEINATNLRGLLWASLLKEDSELTIDEVGSWITMRNVPVIHQALITAWFGSVPEQEESDGVEGEADAQTTAV